MFRHIQRLQARKEMGNINFGICFVLLCSTCIRSISAQVSPSPGPFLEPGSAPELSSRGAPQPSTVPSDAPSESNQQLQSVPSPAPGSASKEFPLLPAPIAVSENSPVPLWWIPPGDQSNANNSPPAPIAPIADTHSVPRLPHQVSPTPRVQKETPHIDMKDGKGSRTLGGGAKAGISFAVIIVIFLVVLSAYVHITRKQNMKKTNTVNRYI